MKAATTATIEWLEAAALTMFVVCVTEVTSEATVEIPAKAELAAFTISLEMEARAAESVAVMEISPNWLESMD